MLLCKSLPFKTNKLWIVELKKIGKNIWDRFSFFLLFTKPEQLCVCILTSKSYWFFKALVNLVI